MSGPLHGKTCLITRVPDDASPMAKGLEAAGARVLCIPTIVVVDPEDWGPVDDALGRPDSYDGLIFTSAKAVNRFVNRATAGQLQRLVGMAVVAVGPKTAAVARKQGFTDVRTPQDHRAEGVVEVLGDVAGRTFLFPRALEAREVIPRYIRDGGGSVDVVTVYETRVAKESEASLRQAIEDGIDCLVFTSSSTARNFAQLVGPSGVEAVQGAVVAVIGPVTANAAADAGLTPTIAPDRATSESLVSAIVKHFEEPAS
jgi:uroporphyrinogen III methyltransferase/synthase